MLVDIDADCRAVIESRRFFRELGICFFRVFKLLNKRMMKVPALFVQ
ncbi:hypothetical protein NEIPOLOT_00363 [Neisseria polysaccharea ATCC 43768]|nr:hypothetical protein NEIPOLOT_00363 [Neisseria polysaccharea ATCC 43768]